MPKFAVIWIANGFDPADPSKVDAFSLECLNEAVLRYRYLKQGGAQVFFPIIKSVVSDPTRQVLLYETLIMAVSGMVEKADLVLLPENTTGSPTDGLAVAMYAKENPEVGIEVFATTPTVADYFALMYPAVSRFIVGRKLLMVITSTCEEGGLKSRGLYTAMRLVTRLAMFSRRTFLAWYRLLNWAYARRLRGFARTVT